ncbi:MAG: DUF2800 domain-containing protein [Bacteroides sp.]|nr:DUF2800 domain-containing protein [Bacteroides sp.]
MKNQECREKRHALLSASGSHRWLNCTPSAVAEAGYPDEGSIFAEEGTLAHAMGAAQLKTLLGRDNAAELREIAELGPKYASGEMEEHVEGYVNFVMERYEEARRVSQELRTADAQIFVETHLDFSDWVPEGFGTGDAVIVGGRTMEIIDLKYGKGVKVDAERNPQMMLYALGAGAIADYAYDIEAIRMTIYQPRVGNLSTWEISPDELLEWAAGRLRPLAEVAYRGLGVRKSGEWCRFCKAKGDCRTLARDAYEITFLTYAPADADELTAEERARVLTELPKIKDWLKAFEEASLARALRGEEIPGWKLVEGRSVRRITDPEAVGRALEEEACAEPEQVWKPRELRTLTELEKTFGRKFFARTCGEWVHKPAGKPALVPVSDKRVALDPASDFDGMEI